LKKDNIVLKDQIYRLQETIKNLKYDVRQTDETLEENSPEGKVSNFISNVPCKTKEPKKSSPSKKGNYHTNTNNKHTDSESNDLMFSFNINSQNKAGSTAINHTQLNGSHRNQIKDDMPTEKNGAFNTVDYSSDDFDDMLRTKNNQYENEILNKHSKTMKKPSKAKESTGAKQLNRQTSQKIISHGDKDQKKHQRHNSFNTNVLLAGKSMEKNQKLIKQYSTQNKKVEKMQCKTQENSEPVENNGKTHRALLTSNMANKSNLSKIKLKIPNKTKANKIGTSTKKHFD